jgi:hypothetical protein
MKKLVAVVILLLTLTGISFLLTGDFLYNSIRENPLDVAILFGLGLIALAIFLSVLTPKEQGA